MRYVYLCLWLSVFGCSLLFGEDHGGGDAHGGGEGSSSPPSKKDGDRTVKEPYAQLGPLTISVIKEGDVLGYIRFTVNLLAEKKEDYESVYLSRPILQNAYIINVSSILREVWIMGTQPRLDNIKNILQQITNKVMGHDRIKAVYMDTYYFAEIPSHLKDQKK